METETHFEPFVHLGGLDDDSALVAWGGFYFKRKPREGWRVCDDEELAALDEGRHDSIGVRSKSYGNAVVEVLDDEGRVVARSEETDRNHTWLRGLQPDTRYTYRLEVDGRPWAEGERLDWKLGPDGEGDLVAEGNEYSMTFRTHPDPRQPAPLRFVVLGDYGIGIDVGEDGRRQARIADALRRGADLAGIRLVVTVGDNIYEGVEGSVHGTGDEDDDWLLSFYQPYRYVIDHIPVYPAVGNHDASDTELSDDREQLADNHYTELRFDAEVEVDRVSVQPGLFYRFHYGADVELVCVDTSLAGEADVRHFFELDDHRAFLDDTFDPSRPDRARWLIPFGHHPPYCAGPDHPNHDASIRALVPRYLRSGVRLVLSGHEHNYQHAVVDDVHYFVSGAGGKLRTGEPRDTRDAGTRAWAAEGHFLVVDVDGDRCDVTAVGDIGSDGALVPISVTKVDGTVAEGRVRVA